MPEGMQCLKFCEIKIIYSNKKFKSILYNMDVINHYVPYNQKTYTSMFSQLCLQAYQSKGCRVLKGGRCDFQALFSEMVVCSSSR